jgi:glutamine---fructose-6-phosphate transaminase (isomerizing)
MCGIVAYIGKRPAVPIVLEGLRRLEYRGYDSAGMAVVDSSGEIQIRRAAGKLQNLVLRLEQAPIGGNVAMGHTRWATHGPAIEQNAHPHSSTDGKVTVIQNGIVENFHLLRKNLQDLGYGFRSDTDTEVIPHLLHHHYHNGCGQNMLASMQQIMAELKGPSAIVVLNHATPDRIMVARLGNAGGVVIGHGDGEMFVASDIPAILPYTQRMTFLENGQIALISAAGVEICDVAGTPVTSKSVTIGWDPAAAQKGTYKHFMQKEIFEQGTSIAATLGGRLDLEQNQVRLDSLNMHEEQARQLSKIVIVACGTSYYAGLVGKFLIEQLARIPVEVDYASEFRYRRPVLSPTDMVLAITQSGETVDTLAALEEAKSHGARTAAIVNAVGSQAARICDGVIPMNVGPEIGVASTKAFTASLVDLFLLGMFLGQARGEISANDSRELIQAVMALPRLVGEVLADAESSGRYRALAERFHTATNFLYLGRGLQYPVALEGALKLKEISYIHAEGYPAGEMKHGPIALIDEQMPTLIMAPRDRVFDKIVSQIEQVKARHGVVLAVAQQDDGYVQEKVDYILPVPACHELLAPVVTVVPLQLFAYEMALYRGADVDQPRNLAKSVTVE